MRLLTPSHAPILEALRRYWLLTTPMVHEVVSPEVGPELVRRRLVAIRQRDWVAFAPNGSPRSRCWYLTDAGASAVGLPRPPLTPERAAGPLQHHDLGVNEVGILLQRVARAQGHEVMWRRETSYPLAPANAWLGLKNSRGLIADALLEHWLPRQAIALRFVELDRSTEMLTEVMGKLIAYASLKRESRVNYHGRFPLVMLVFAGPAPEVRAADLLALAKGNPEVRALRPLVVLMEHLRRKPEGRVFRIPGVEGWVDWLGHGE